jgi:hypothetical protein
MPCPPSAEDRFLAVAAATLHPVVSRALGLSAYNKASVTAFVSGDPGEIDKLVEDTRRLAEALAAPGPSGDWARVMLLSRVAVTCRTELRVLETPLTNRRHHNPCRTRYVCGTGQGRGTETHGLPLS